MERWDLNRAESETESHGILFRCSCSVDPYLFENFDTDNGDFLAAKFRAFKFPESTYVQFRGTVNVCVDKCNGVQCNNGQVGYGRKKRAVPASRADPNKVYEISMTTFIKVNYDDKADKGKPVTRSYHFYHTFLIIYTGFFPLADAINELEMKLKQLQIANQKLARNSRGSSVVLEKETVSYSSDGQRATVEDVTTLTKIQQGAAMSPNSATTVSSVVSSILIALTIHRFLQ